jgi:hypothetical protein
MATLSPNELLAQLQKLAASSPQEITSDTTLRTQLATAAKKAFLVLEKPEDVVARLLLSQVCSLPLCYNEILSPPWLE